MKNHENSNWIEEKNSKQTFKSLWLCFHWIKKQGEKGEDW